MIETSPVWMNPGRGVVGFVILGKLFHPCVLRPTQPSIHGNNSDLIWRWKSSRKIESKIAITWHEFSRKIKPCITIVTNLLTYLLTYQDTRIENCLHAEPIPGCRSAKSLLLFQFVFAAYWFPFVYRLHSSPYDGSRPTVFQYMHYTGDNVKVRRYLYCVAAQSTVRNSACDWKLLTLIHANTTVPKQLIVL